MHVKPSTWNGGEAAELACGCTRGVEEQRKGGRNRIWGTGERASEREDELWIIMAFIYIQAKCCKINTGVIAWAVRDRVIHSQPDSQSGEGR